MSTHVEIALVALSGSVIVLLCSMLVLQLRVTRLKRVNSDLLKWVAAHKKHHAVLDGAVKSLDDRADVLQGAIQRTSSLTNRINGMLAVSGIALERETAPPPKRRITPKKRTKGTTEPQPNAYDRLLEEDD